MGPLVGGGPNTADLVCALERLRREQRQVVLERVGAADGVGKTGAANTHTAPDHWRCVRNSRKEWKDAPHTYLMASVDRLTGAPLHSGQPLDGLETQGWRYLSGRPIIRMRGEVSQGYCRPLSLGEPNH